MVRPNSRTPLPIPRTGTEGVAWPAVSGGMPVLMLAALQQLEHSQYLPPAELRARQFKQLDQLLAHADQHIPFHRERLRAAAWRPEVSLTEESWARIPILSRREVQEAGAALQTRTVPQQHGETIADATSGSTGMPVTVLKTALSQFFWNVITLREMQWHGRDLGGKFVAIRRDDARPADHQGIYATPLPDWGPPVASVYPTGPAALADVRASIAEQAAWLAEQQPDYLLSFGITLRYLARHCRERGIKLPSLRGLISSGEVLTEETRDVCREVWGLEVVDMYSAVEVGHIAVQCPNHPHLHAQSEAAMVEVLDEVGKPCQPGEVGRVVVTPLHNFATPLIRYAVGDLAEMGEACRCGRTLPVLRRVLGRTRDMLVLPTGERRFPFYPWRQLASFDALVQHQIIQISLEEIEIRVVARRRFTPDEEARLCALIVGGFGHPFRARVTYCDAIVPLPGGKFQEFRCEVT